MRIRPRHLAFAAAAIVAGGLAFAWSGLFNVAASSGHWAVTEWFLHWVMRNSVRTHALGIDVPPLDDAALVQRGAGHFAAGCAPCHGAPGAPRSAVVREMTPAPPSLGERVSRWTPNQLFWIVRHGVKYTGMPAWPADGRDDEVWAVVAFLLKLPGLDAGGYRQLAFGAASGSPPEPHGDAGGRLETLLDGCVGCHGRDGQGGAPGAFPNLKGQSERYLAATLAAYAERRRNSGIMQLAAHGLDAADVAALAAHYAGTVPSRDRSEAPNDGEGGHDLGEHEGGRRLADSGAPADGVPACRSCHGGGDSERYPAYPALDGLDAEYIATQLELFRQGLRGGTPYSGIMRTIAARLSPEQIEAVAGYFAGLPAASEGASD